MDMITHTAIAVASLAASYYLGAFFTSRNFFENRISNLLDKLEKDGFIVTKLDKDGDKELIPVNEVVSNALADARIVGKTLKLSKD